MKITKEINMENFNAWSGAIDTLEMKKHQQKHKSMIYFGLMMNTFLNI
jgi:hypothetical protein